MFSYLSTYLENLSCCLNETRNKDKKDVIDNNIRLKIKKI